MDKKAIKGIQSDLILQAMAEEDKNIYQEMQDIIHQLDGLLTMDLSPLEQVIDEILGNINFQRVRDAMLQQNWVWARSSPVATPTIAEMQEEVKRQIESVWNGNIEYTSCGGFTTTKYVNPDTNTVVIKVAFELTSFESDTVDYERTTH
jgi:hypothetical protein